MPNAPVYVVNLDDSVACQKNLITRYAPFVLDLTDIGPYARLWLDKKTRVKVRQRLAAIAPGAVTFIGSGDFHHLTEMLLEKLSDEFCLIIFDNHPDWETLPPRYGCGAWVAEALKKVNILKAVSVGPASGDLSTWRIQSGDIAALKDNRLEIYPFAQKPTRVFFKAIPENVSLRLERGMFSTKICWDTLDKYKTQEQWNDFFMRLIKRLPTRNVYISVDKDCLVKEEALTNWEEGCLSLEQLLLGLRLIRQNLNVLGVDICGDYSRVQIASRVKSSLSFIDHPKRVPADRLCLEEITAVNETTNLKILEALL